jgi:hypothetical protein
MMADSRVIEVFSGGLRYRMRHAHRTSLLHETPGWHEHQVPKPMTLFPSPSTSLPYRGLLAALLLASQILPEASLAGEGPHMTVIENKDVSGTVYKKLGLPERHYCWDTCLKEDRCSGVRWGVIEGDTAGLCLLLTGPLTLKAPTTPKTEDGKPIHVTSARKDSSPRGGT